MIMASEEHMETPSEFRLRLRTWLERQVGQASNHTHVSRRERRPLWQRMFKEGFYGLTWPREFGGRALTAEYQSVFNEVAAEYPLAMPDLVTTGICAPVIMEFGSPDQCRRYLPAMLEGTEQWTQLLSEPDAGSDLANVGTRAALLEDGWRLSGQKVWTSAADESEYALALVRTDRSQHRQGGLTMMVVDLRSPGVDIRPLRQMTGDAVFFEVFLDGVFVPNDAVIGTVNDGWGVLRRMLYHERVALSAGTAGGRLDKESFLSLLTLAQRYAVMNDPDIRQKLGEVYIQQTILEAMGKRIREATETGQPMGPVGSLGKVATARSARLSAELGVQIASVAGVAWEDESGAAATRAHQLLYFPMAGIAGGTTEIQRNVIAERLLGLPRD